MMQIVRVALLHFVNSVLQMLAIWNIQNWNAILSGTVNRLHQGILYFQNIKAVSWYPCKRNFIYTCKKVQSSLGWFSCNSPMINSTMCRPLYQNLTKSDNTCGKCGTNFTYVTNVATFTKPTIIEPIVLDSSCAKFYLNQTKM